MPEAILRNSSVQGPLLGGIGMGEYLRAVSASSLSEYDFTTRPKAPKPHATMQMMICSTQKVMRKALFHRGLPLVDRWISLGRAGSSNEDRAAGWYAVSVFIFMLLGGEGASV
jgi:hypothetical protein